MIKKIEVGGVRYSIQAENTIKVTWAELKTLRDEAKLNAGTFYRITDYVTTTTQSETKSANHPFDVIVLALSEKTISEDAKAALHEGDTYFADSDLSAWELKYCLDNDKTRFEWADETNGKGVIYRMVDEKRNDCPYDFKNILFYNTTFMSDITSDRYYYTFSVVIRQAYDGTTDKRMKSCYGNMMGGCYQSGALRLNKNVFRNISFSYSLNFNILRENCYSNTFGNNCSSNTFGENCYSNTFGNNCSSNTFGENCSSNTFRNNCSSNTFGDNLQNRYLDANKTSITLNEEFYDDGSGHLVPTKHPDISTQPNILPYKFMGQYVYEQLIPNITLGALLNSKTYFCQDLGLAVKESPYVISANAIIKTEFGVMTVPITTYIEFAAITFQCHVFNRIQDKCELGDYLLCQIHLIYTSMPEAEVSSYYGYNNYGGNIEDFSNAVVIRLEGDYTSVQKVYFLDESIERINDNTYVYRNLSSAPSTTGTVISIVDSSGTSKTVKSAKIYLDGVELDSTKMVIQSYGPIDFTTPLELNKYNTIEAIVNLR